MLFDLKDRFLNFITDRTVLLYIVIGVLSFVLIHKIFVLQIVNGQAYLDNFTLSIEKEINIPSSRGNIYDRNGVLLQQFLHRLQYPCCGHSVLLYLGQVGVHHIEDIERVFVNIFGKLFFSVLNVVFQLFCQACCKMGEVVDVVERVKDPVDEAFRKFTDSNFPFLLYELAMGGFQFLCPFIYNLFKAFLLLF